MHMTELEEKLASCDGERIRLEWIQQFEELEQDFSRQLRLGGSPEVFKETEAMHRAVRAALEVLKAWPTGSAQKGQSALPVPARMTDQLPAN
jgi:type III secretion system YseE family protein